MGQLNQNHRLKLQDALHDLKGSYINTYRGPGLYVVIPGHSTRYRVSASCSDGDDVTAVTVSTFEFDPGSWSEWQTEGYTTVATFPGFDVDKIANAIINHFRSITEDEADLRAQFESSWDQEWEWECFQANLTDIDLYYGQNPSDEEREAYRIATRQEFAAYKAERLCCFITRHQED